LAAAVAVAVAVVLVEIHLAHFHRGDQLPAILQGSAVYIN
jgi:hypothetical protein